MMWDSVSILADDLTGLAETIQAVANPFFQKQWGYETIVHPLPLVEGYANLQAFSINGFNTNHRACSVETVKSHTLQWIKTVSASTSPATLFYQKMDSTLRGSWAVEAQQWVASEKVELVWCCPAYPQQGRTTQNGFHFLNNTALHKTAMAKDPTHPISAHELTAYLTEAGVDAETILPITVEDIETFSVNDWVERLQTICQEKGISWIVQDAITPEHLEKMAAVVHQLKLKNGLPPTLFLGSGGWAGALARCETATFEQNPEPSFRRGGFETLPLLGAPQLVVSGSVNPTTLAQIAYLKQTNNPNSRWVLVWEAVGGSLKSTQTLLEECQAISPDETVILTTCTSLEERTNSTAKQTTLKETLSTVLNQLFQTVDFKHVICCGGETSLLTLKAANAPLLQWHPQGGEGQFPQFESDSGCTWVFKSGNMGESGILDHLLQQTIGHPLK